MHSRNGLRMLVLLTALAAQPALAQVQIVDVPSMESIAEDSSAGTLQATRADHVGFSLDELFVADAAQTCPGGGNATFTWTIKDGCLDGSGIYVRFFDETNNLVFPNGTQAYVVNSGRSSVIKLTVKRGAKICYGAEPTDLDGSFWGVGLDNDQGCSSCCNVVPSKGNIARTVNLICS